MIKKIFLLSLFVFLFPKMNNSAEKPQNFTLDRQRMVEQQIAARGVRDERVLDAMRKVPRHLFVPESQRSTSYADFPLP